VFRDADGGALTTERAYEMLLEYVTQMGMGEKELHRLL
jgi:hypothetical protein